MDIVLALFGGGIATAVLTLEIKNFHKLKLVLKEWDILEDGVAPLMRINKIQVYILHVLAEAVIFPIFFVFVWTKTLNLNLLNNIIVNAAVFAFCIFVLASIVPILKTPKDYKFKALLSLFLARMAYGVVLGFVMAVS